MTFTVRETAKIDGGAYRVVRFEDGSERVEEWTARGWIPGGATFGEFLETPPVSARFAAELGIPLSDIMVREPDTTSSPASSSKLTADDLREAISVGVRLAEEAALFKVMMKAKQVAERDRRPRLVYNRDRGGIN